MELAERPQRGAVAPAAGAALVAGIVGGVVWALIVRSTEYEIGVVAWAIGWLAGTAAVTAGRGVRGPRVQAAAIAAAVVGILLGKYLAFAWALQEAAENAGVSIGLFSGETRSYFRDELGSVFGWMDLFFAGLAVYTAWRIPQRPRLPPAPGPQASAE